MKWLWVGLGGGLGSMLRFGIAMVFGKTRFPWATLTVNLVGSFILGFLASWAMNRWGSALTTALTVGLLGGFTTFSALTWESASMLRSGRSGVAIAYLAVSIFGGLAAAFAGIAASHSLA